MGNKIKYLRHAQKRSERVELRVTPDDRELLIRVAQQKRRPLSSIVEEMFDWLREQNP